MKLADRISRSAWLAFCITFLLDRVTKGLVLNYKPRALVIIKNFCMLHTTKNRGISWGMLYTHQNTLYWLLTAGIIGFLGFFAYYAFSGKKLTQWSYMPEALILAGGMSNVIDRIVYHGVIDFILIYWQDWSFPIFNVADCAIVLGVLIIMIDIMRNK